MKFSYRALLSPTYLFLYYKKYKIEKLNKLKKLKIGMNVSVENCTWGNYNFVSDNCILKNVTLGDYSYLNQKVELNNVKIGKFCSIGPNVKIGFGAHPTHIVSTHPCFYSNNKPFDTFADDEYFNEYSFIEIGNDVWIGSDVKIIGNLTVGDGSIIAAGAVVTKNVEPYSIVGGVSAKHIKYRFEPSVIQSLLNTKWWDMDIDWIKTNFRSFLSINEFFSEISNKK